MLFRIAVVHIWRESYGMLSDGEKVLMKGSLVG